MLIFIITSLLFGIAFPLNNGTDSIGDTNGNVCTFRYRDKLFSLINSQGIEPYRRGSFENGGKILVWNFCLPFKPQQCAENQTVPQAFSFLIQKKQVIVPIEEDSVNMTEPQFKTIEQYTCIPYSSNSTTDLYRVEYHKESSGNNNLVMTLNEKNPYLIEKYRKTVLTIHCSIQDQFLNVSGYKYNDTVLEIQGKSKSGCPLFSISSLWTALQEHKFFFGSVMFLLGVLSLFFGRAMLIVTIFIATYFISFIVLGALFTIFLKPDTSLIVVYFALIFLLFIATLLAYAATKLVNVSIFFIGAWLGFIMGALVNTIFCKIFDVYSVWSLVVFEVLFMIPCGLLTFKYADIIVIISTSLTGAYMIVRPISWIFGGFPNEFLLQELIQSGQLSTLPWTFFLYLVFIVAIAILGALYQFLKLRRQNSEQQIQVNFVEAQLQESVDQVKDVIDGIIERYKSDSHSEDYKKMKEMDQRKKVHSDQN